MLIVDYKFNDVHARGQEWFDRPYPNLKGIKLDTRSDDHINLPNNPTWQEIIEGIDYLIDRSGDHDHRFLGYYNFETKNNELVVDDNGYVNLHLDS